MKNFLKQLGLTLLAATLFGNGIQVAEAQNMDLRISSGEERYMLFPQGNDGRVRMVDTIRCEASASEISDAVKSFFVQMDMRKDVDVDQEKSTMNRWVYEIQIEFDEYYFDVQSHDGLFGWDRDDASEVELVCDVFFQDHLCIVTLSDFETDRVTLRGDAKSDGDPNWIHWQRVGCLQQELNRIKSDSRRAREKQYDLQRQIEREHYWYANEYNSVNTLLEGLRMTLSPETFGRGTYDLHPVDAVYEPFPKENVVLSDRSNYHGSLLAKGNYVYVSSGGESYEKAGRAELVKQIALDGFWQVVDRREDAQFVIEYYLETKGSDYGYLNICDVSGEHRVTKMPGNRASSNESASGNREAARALYFKVLCKLQKKIEKGTLPAAFGELYVK